ncbi:MAG: RNA 2',3'-cyclic phosphodiesterase [Chloroflexi bacterium]|nr:RNA 2',3'-cyclic phosphodiesterase [Chloroflexota bacterium]
MNTVRAFIGIHLPKSVQDALLTVRRQLSAQLPVRSVRWVQPDRMHLTVRFLGDTAVSHLSQIAAGLDQICASQTAMQLQLSELGCFPSQRRPRVIWAGLVGDVPKLQIVRTAIDEMLLPLGWEKDKRPFNPHLTLGRVKEPYKVARVKWESEVEQAILAVTAVHLIESQLKPSGPEYIVRHSSNFSD